MKKILILPFGLMALALLIGGDVFAYQGDPSVKGPSYSEERHSQMTEVFKKGDYLSWKNLMLERGNSKVTEVINEGNFNKFTEIHNLMLDGKIEEAKELRKELGLGLKNGTGPKKGSGYGRNK